VVPEKVSLNAGIVVGGVNWSILIDAGKVGINIVFPVEQLAATTIINEKPKGYSVTEGKSESEHLIVTKYVPATSDVYRV
jgi:hypothetical protein